MVLPRSTGRLFTVSRGFLFFGCFMLNYFRSTDPYRLLGLLLFMALINLPWWIDWPGITLPELKSMIVGIKVREGFSLYTEIIDRTPPLASLFYGLCQWLFGTSLPARHIVAFFILFLLSAFYALLLINKKAFPENTMVPALVFFVVLSASFDMNALTAELPAFTFLLIALKLLMDEIEFREQRDETILNLGLSTGTASLFVFTYMLFLPGIIMLLLLFTRLSVRRLLLLLFGFSLPHGLLSGYYYYNHSSADLFERFYRANLFLHEQALMRTQDLLILFAVPLVFLFLSFFVLNRNARLTKYQSQMLQIMMLWLLLSFIHALAAKDLRPQSFLPAVPAISFLLTHHFLLIKRKFADLHIWVFILGTITVAFFARYEILPVGYDKLLVQSSALPWKEKRILDLTGENINLYVNNTPAPPVTDAALAREILQHPDTYESVVLINHLFRIDPPEIVLDSDDALTPFMQRIPALQNAYERKGDRWIKKPNN